MAQHFSKMVATPWPPPMHRVARPSLASGLFEQMEAQGIQDGDTVDLYGLQFEYQR